MLIEIGVLNESKATESIYMCYKLNREQYTFAVTILLTIFVMTMFTMFLYELPPPPPSTFAHTVNGIATIIPSILYRREKMDLFVGYEFALQSDDEAGMHSWYILMWPPNIQHFIYKLATVTQLLCAFLISRVFCCCC